jgi:hypothetical protein
MYQELCDPNSEYTFDEQGEYLLAKMLEYQLSQYECYMDSFYDLEDSDENEDAEPDITGFWNTSLTPDEIKYVKDYANDYFKGLKQDAIDEGNNDTSWYDEMEELFVERISNFPLMAYEITEDVTPEFLFWDTDFLLVEKWGMENFEMIKDIIAKRGSNLGFSGVDENTQLYTGSSKFELSNK